MKLRNADSGRATGRALIALSTTSLTTRPAFDIAAAKVRLHGFHTGMRGHEFAMYIDMRNFGLTWADICAYLDDRTQHPDGRRQSAEKWARENAPYIKRWMDEYKKFALEEWDDFVKAWKWAENTPYAPDRRPSLQTARELIATRIRVETYQSAAKTARSGVRAKPVAEGPAPTVAEETDVNPIAKVLCGDAVTMMRRHIPDNSIDLETADPPWFLGIPDKPTPTDYYYNRYGMPKRFRAELDNFPSADEYIELAKSWLSEAKRVLRLNGSLFVMGGFRSISLVGFALQTMEDMNIVQDICVVKTNGRPTGHHPGLQFSHFYILWVTKRRKGHRFNRADCKRATYPNDPFNNTRGRMMLDTWVIQNNGHETKGQFQAQKVVEVYNRILTVAGKPGGTMLDIFSGSGSGAIAAMRGGMKSISVERDPKTVAHIIERIKAETQRR